MTIEFVSFVGAPLTQLRLHDDAPGGAPLGVVARPCAGAGAFSAEPTVQCSVASSNGVTLRLSLDVTGGGFPTLASAMWRLQAWTPPGGSSATSGNASGSDASGSRLFTRAAGRVVVAALPSPDGTPGMCLNASLVCTVQATLVDSVGPTSTTHTATLPIELTRAAWPVVADVLVHEAQGSLVRSTRAGGEGINAAFALASAASALLGVDSSMNASAALDHADVVQAALRTLGLFPPPPPPTLAAAPAAASDAESDDDASSARSSGASFMLSASSGSRVTLVASGASFARFSRGIVASVGAAACRLVWVSNDGSLAHCELPRRDDAYGAEAAAVGLQQSSLLLPLAVSWQPQQGGADGANATASSSQQQLLTMSCPPLCPGAPLAAAGGSATTPAVNARVLVALPIGLAPSPSTAARALSETKPLSSPGGVLSPAWFTAATGTLRLSSTAEVAADLTGSSGVQLFEPCALEPPGTPSPGSGVCTNASDPRAAACLYGEGDACRPCPEGALCPGGFRLWSRAGSFVATAAAAVAVPCAPPVNERCVGWDARAGTTQCGAAYRAGSFACLGCAPRHYAAQDGVCEPCPRLAAGRGLVAVLTTLLAFGAGLAGFVGFNYVAIKLIVHWRGGTVNGGIKRSLSLFVWMFGTLQLVAVVCSTAAPGLPPAVRGLVSMLNVFTFEALVPPAACLPGTPPLSMQLRVMALALALAAAWPLVSALAAWAGRHAETNPAAKSEASDETTALEGERNGDERGSVATSVTLGSSSTSRDGQNAGSAAAAPPKSLAARFAALRRQLVPQLPTAFFGALGLLYPIASEYAMSMLHCGRVAVPLGTYLGMDRGAGSLTAVSASVRSLLEGGQDGGAVVLSAALADGSLRAALAAPVPLVVLQEDPMFVCWVGSHAPVGTLAAFTLLGVVLAVPLAAAWLLWRTRGARAAAGAAAAAQATAPAEAAAATNAPATTQQQQQQLQQRQQQRKEQPNAVALAAAGIGNEFVEGREWITLVDMAAIFVTTVLLVLLKAPSGAPSVAARLAVTLLVLGSVGATYALRSPYDPGDPWKLVAKQSSLVLATLAAVLSAVQVLQPPESTGVRFMSWLTFLVALAVFALITVAFWLALINGAMREAAAAAAAAAAARGVPTIPEPAQLPLLRQPRTRYRLPLMMHAPAPEEGGRASAPLSALVDVDATTPFTAINPMQQVQAAAKSTRRLPTRDEEELGDGTFNEEQPPVARSSSMGAGSVRALRSFYQSRASVASSSLPASDARSGQHRVVFVGGTRLVRAASTRQIGSVERSGRTSFAPSLSSRAEGGGSGGDDT